MTQPSTSPVTTPDLDVRRGYRTTEFWVAVTTWLLPILTLLFHRDLSSLAVPLATLAAGMANGAYAISRAITKSGQAKAAAGATVAQATVATVQHIDVKELTTWVSTMAGAVQALTAALAAAQPTDGKVRTVPAPAPTLAPTAAAAQS